MGFFDFFKMPDINQGLQNYKKISGAVLLDVRTSEEYREGHVAGSKNLPLQSIANVTSITNRKDTPLFVYCHSGSRSRQATSMLEKMGYTNVTNIGGIISYSGKIER